MLEQHDNITVGVASSLLECGGTTCPIQMDDSLNGVMFPGVSVSKYDK